MTKTISSIEKEFGKFLTCNGPFDEVHRCSALHCDHCGRCDILFEIKDFFIKEFTELLKEVMPEEHTETVHCESYCCQTEVSKECDWNKAIFQLQERLRERGIKI